MYLEAIQVENGLLDKVLSEIHVPFTTLVQQTLTTYLTEELIAA